MGAAEVVIGERLGAEHNTRACRPPRNQPGPGQVQGSPLFQATGHRGPSVTPLLNRPPAPLGAFDSSLTLV
jgi:hypothetical protein